ncbi:DUF3617 domain-containing protein [Lysobacter sp. CA199]|uniref:DUF3617 domain-containing protein n=1 Tax=Lysobacter sp. CA199 TaxID=3455608 RepID=UPI003F8D5716
MTGKTCSAFVLTLAMAATGLGCSQPGKDAAAPTPASAGQTADGAATTATTTAAVVKTKLKAGLWRVEGPQFDALSERGKVYLCVDAASAALIDPPLPPADQAKCSIDDGTPKPDLYLGTVECRYPDRTVIARVRIDSNNLYFRDVIVQRGATPAENAEKTSVFAEWTGPCRPEQTPGSAYTQTYGEDAMHAAELPAGSTPAASGS